MRRKLLIVLDVLMILTLLFHIGALFLTQLSVAKAASLAGEELVFKEGNPVTAQVLNLEMSESPRNRLLGYQALIGWAIHIAMMALGGAGYLYLRFGIKNKKDAFRIICVALFSFLMTITDFTSNLGLYVGKWLFSSIV